MTLLSPMMRHSICEVMEYLVSLSTSSASPSPVPPQLKKMSPIKVQVTQGRRGGAGHTIQKNKDPCYKRDQAYLQMPASNLNKDILLDLEVMLAPRNPSHRNQKAKEEQKPRNKHQFNKDKLRNHNLNQIIPIPDAQMTV